MKQEEKLKDKAKRSYDKKFRDYDDYPDDTLVMNSPRKLILKIILGLVIGMLAFFFTKTALWEKNYYEEKEGSTRAVAQSLNDEEAPTPVEVDETPVTEQQVYEYTVPADNPRYLSIPKLGIANARVLSVGITRKGELDTPINIFDVGWYNQSSKPGAKGVLVIDGHNGGPNVEGVFKHLNQLYSEDVIVIERGDGQKFTYKVVENKEIPLSEADSYMSTAFTSPVPGTESLTLITCVGEWSQVQQTYLSRQFVRAVLIKE